MTVELLKAAARLGVDAGIRQLVPGDLRFVLSYRVAPDVERERTKLETLLGAPGFEFFPLPPGDDPRALVLQFPGVKREQSSNYLFATADELAELLELEACSPDANPGWIAEDELGRDAPESIGGVIWETCRAHVSPPVKTTWSIETVKAPEAWRKFGARGRNVRVGQPDTGVADHRELDSAVNTTDGIDVIIGHGPPIDPLSPRMGSPGHGTATASVVASRLAGRVSGVAPEVELVPLRCVDSVILSSGAAVAAAIDHARRLKCDVVTMSLGGPFPYPELQRAIKRAVDDGMIVLAAAGNCVGLVVYPAWDANVIAVAAVAQSGRPWTGSSQGSKVDISAPGEHVYVARRTGPSDADLTRVEPGEGTSFAVATVAGCAALWISKHGKNAIKAAAAKRGTTVQGLFRGAVRQTAYVPSGWNNKRMGAGIANAEDLLALNLDEIQLAPTMARPERAHPAWSRLGAKFDWARYGTEAGFLAFDRAQRKSTGRIAALESPVEARPSPGFLKAARQAGADKSDLVRPTLILNAPLTPQIGPAAALRLLARLPSGGAESGGAITEASARSYLQGSGSNELLGLFDDVSGYLERSAPRDLARAELRAEIKRLVPGVVARFASGKVRRSSDFRGMSRVAAEALIRLTGRPALRLTGGVVSLDDPQLGAWVSDVYGPRNILLPLVSAVGRIDVLIDGVNAHVGTGIHVAKGVILTNRHVLDAFAEPIPSAGTRRFQFSAEASIAFDDTASDPEHRFRIKSVIAAGPARIGSSVDIRRLDMAFLEVESHNDAGKDLPGPTSSAAFAADADGRATSVAVVGFPAKPNLKAVVDPETGKASEKMVDALWAIYHTDFGVKYLSPGEVMSRAGALSSDPNAWAFSHDATTLGGNSGSAVMQLGAAINLCGLHFGGAPMRQNLGHDLAAVKTRAQADPTLLGSSLPF